jgi:hypothetical protein
MQKEYNQLRGMRWEGTNEDAAGGYVAANRGYKESECM